MTSVKAIIKPDLLIWARKSAGFKKIEDAAAKIKVSTGKLSDWEAGLDSPTIVQLRIIANVYKRPIAVFYLPAAPRGVDVLHDFRTIPGGKSGEFSPELTYEIRKAYHRREKALDLYDELGEKPTPVSLRAVVGDDVDQLGSLIRDYLKVSKATQESWKNSYDALNAWKSAIESHEILIFQASRVSVSEMRGFSIAAQPVPVIVLNSADSPNARIFTLIHELTHISLQSDGVCTLDSTKDRIEVFCNAVAGTTLLPQAWLSGASATWSDDEVRQTAKRFSLSNQVVLRRLLTLGKVSETKFNTLQSVYDKEAKEFAAQQHDKDIVVAQSTKALASSGKLFAKLVLDSYHRNKVTSADVSDLLSVRVKHLKDIETKVYGEAVL